MLPCISILSTCSQTTNTTNIWLIADLALYPQLTIRQQGEDHLDTISKDETPKFRVEGRAVSPVHMMLKYKNDGNNWYLCFASTFDVHDNSTDVFCHIVLIWIEGNKNNE
jgi:hypothetical protein